MWRLQVYSNNCFLFAGFYVTEDHDINEHNYLFMVIKQPNFWQPWLSDLSSVIFFPSCSPQFVKSLCSYTALTIGYELSFFCLPFLLYISYSLLCVFSLFSAPYIQLCSEGCQRLFSQTPVSVCLQHEFSSSAITHWAPSSERNTHTHTHTHTSCNHCLFTHSFIKTFSVTHLRTLTPCSR